MDPLKQAAERFRSVAEKDPGGIGHLTAREIADLLDPPPEPEPEIPPGELVKDKLGGLLFTTTAEPLRLDAYMDLRPDPGAGALRSVQPRDVQRFVDGNFNFVTCIFRTFARLVISQEPKPELKGEDKENYTVVEKRIGHAGQYTVSTGDGRVRILAITTALLVWIVKPKENSNERQGTDA